MGYRLFLLDEADARFLTNFDARNVVMGSSQAVVVLAGGEREAVEDFAELVKTVHPESAVVSDVRVEEYRGSIRTIESFRSSFSIHQLCKIASAGVKMLEKQDEMLRKQDLMLEKMDLMLKKQDEMLRKQDLMLEKMDLMLKKQDELRECVERGFQELREEHVRTGETLLDIFRSEVQQLRREMDALRSSVEEIKRRVGIA